MKCGFWEKMPFVRLAGLLLYYEVTSWYRRFGFTPLYPYKLLYSFLYNESKLLWSFLDISLIPDLSFDPEANFDVFLLNSLILSVRFLILVLLYFIS